MSEPSIADHNCFEDFFLNPSPATVQHMNVDHKILHSKKVIKEFYDFMNGSVYVSFSGGKDSTVLLHLVRSIYPDTPAVFYDTGLEFPEIVEHVKKQENTSIIKPTRRGKRVSFRQIILDKGYPVISKEVAKAIHEARNGSEVAIGKMTAGDGGRFDFSRYNWVMDAPFKISGYCCDAMKKGPSAKYYRETGLAPFIGTRNDESRLRRDLHAEKGENRYKGKVPKSNPLSIWTDQDIDTYIARHNIELCKVYTEMGYKRTGCMFCMFGVHLDPSPNAFQMMKYTHPKQYNYCMKSVEEGGLGLASVLDFLGVDRGELQTHLDEFKGMGSEQEAII